MVEDAEMVLDEGIHRGDQVLCGFGHAKQWGFDPQQGGASVVCCEQKNDDLIFIYEVCPSCHVEMGMVSMEPPFKRQLTRTRQVLIMGFMLEISLMGLREVCEAN